MPESTISACLIVKNEEDRLPGCLDSLYDIVDEIVVVDTGSSDDTVKVAEEYNAEIYHFEWTGHFGEARNYSFNQATSEWILYIDADERLSPELQRNIIDLVKVDGDVLYKLPIEDEILSCAGPRDGMIRLWKRGLFRFKEGQSKGIGAPTQKQSYGGEVKNAAYPIIHCQRNNHWIVTPTRILPRIEIDAKNTPKNHHSIYFYTLAIYGFFKHFAKWYIKKEGYKDGLLGLKFAFMKGLYKFLENIFIALRPKREDAWKEWRRDEIADKLREI